MKQVWQAADPCIPVQHQPTLVLAYARSRDLGQRTVLPGTGLDGWDGDDGGDGHQGRAISPQQYLRLLANVAGGLNSADTSFQLGQQMLPGHFGAISHAVLQAGSLRDAISLLIRYQIRLCPLLAPHFSEAENIAALYWTDAFGAASQRGFLVEQHMTALTAMCRWLSGERLPWRYCFNRTQPRYTEQHEVHLGAHCRFNCQIDGMLIDADWLDRPWPRGNATAAAIALANAEPFDTDTSLLGALYNYLLAHIRRAPSLDQCAASFGVSAATLKRQLARHGTHFQAELDQARAHEALRLMHGGLDNEAVARHLGFHDANNFRRSFKRWTGMTPMLLRTAIQSK